MTGNTQDLLNRGSGKLPLSLVTCRRSNMNHWNNSLRQYLICFRFFTLWFFWTRTNWITSYHISLNRYIHLYSYIYFYIENLVICQIRDIFFVLFFSITFWAGNVYVGLEPNRARGGWYSEWGGKVLLHHCSHLLPPPLVLPLLFGSIDLRHFIGLSTDSKFQWGNQAPHL